mgnify:CR=1 FL=1
MVGDVFRVMPDAPDEGRAAPRLVGLAEEIDARLGADAADVLVGDEGFEGVQFGGQPIAGTGTISDDGSVGPIGGIRQKLAGARSGGARWFLAPADNCDEVVDHVPDGLRVVKVATFDQARAAVEAIAKAATGDLASCTR